MNEKWMPSGEHLLLLKAALLKDESAVLAWREWRKNLDLDNIDPASYGIVPRLYRNLVDLKVDDVYLQRYKGMYRSHWTRNQIDLYCFAILLKRLYHSGIKEVVLLKGAAMSLFQYGDYGIRPFGDIDFLVKHKDVFPTIDLLIQLGWQPIGIKPEAIDEGFVAAHHGLGFINEKSQPKLLDLHWQILPEHCGQDYEDLLFEPLLTTELHGVKVQALDSALMFYHTCLHGTKISPVPLIRWIPDAMQILRNKELAIDWPRLVEMTRVTNLSLPMISALKYLNETFDAKVPLEVIEDLESIPVTVRERTEYYLRVGGLTNHMVAIAASVWYQYSRSMKGRSLLIKLLGFPRYLKNYWGVKSIFSVPIYATKKLVKAGRDALRFAR